MKDKKQSALRAGFGYTIGNYLLKGLGFITVPIFARLLETSDFGIYNTFLSYEGILYLFVGLAVHTSIKNAKYRFTSYLEEYTSSISLIPTVTAVLLLFLGNMFSSNIEKCLGLDRMQTNLLILMCWGTSLLYIYQSRLVLDYVTKEYLSLSYFNTIVSVVLSILLVIFIFPEEKYLGRIVGTVVPMVVIGIWILFRLYKRARPRINLIYWKYGLTISLPVIPHGIGQVILSSFDRIMITNMVGASESGLYSFAYSIYSIVYIAGNSISTVFEPWAFSKISENKTQELQERAKDYVMGLAVICAGVMLLAPEVVVILGSQKYVEAIPAVIPVIFGGFFAMAYTMPSIIEYYKEKTGFIAVGTGAAAVLNIVLNSIFIPKYGYIAAAYTTLVSYFLYYIFHSIVSYMLSGFFVIPLSACVAAMVMLTLTAVISLLFQDSMLIRWGVGIVILIVAALYGLRAIKKIKRQP